MLIFLEQEYYGDYGIECGVFWDRELIGKSFEQMLVPSAGLKETSSRC